MNFIIFSLHIRLINNLKQTRILTHNNLEEPIEFNSANFTQAIFKGMKSLDMHETYPLQAYAWFVLEYIKLHYAVIFSLKYQYQCRLNEFI